MSTLTYAALTNNRERAQPGTSISQSPPGLRTYVDAFAALVPAEVLTMHALIISVTTSTTTGDNPITKITDALTLKWAFCGLIALSIILYVASRLMNGKWENLDYFRASIPPLAFIGWTMLQRSTAFDAVYPQMPDAARAVIALFLGVLLGLLASALAYKADQKIP